MPCKLYMCCDGGNVKREREREDKRFGYEESKEIARPGSFRGADKRFAGGR